jgi:hypothetical protein
MHDEAFKQTRQRGAHGFEPFGVVDLTRDRASNVGEAAQRRSLDIADLAPALDLVLVIAQSS